MMLPMTLAETGMTSTGEAVFFWVVAPLAVIAALGLIFARKAVYAAMCVVFVMIALAGFYIAQEAVFLGVAQIIVYTGAIMMLFLFVLMLVGVDASDSVIETLKGQRWIAALAGLGLIVLFAGIIRGATMPAPRGLAAANADTNPVGVARLLFSDYVFTMQVTGIMLVTAAVGAVVLTRAESLRTKLTQRDVVEAKMAAFADGGRIRGLPAPGVYARHNAADVPALGADGKPIDESVPRVLRIRGQQRTIASVSPEVVAALAARAGAGHAGDLGARTVQQSGEPGMPGTEHAPGTEPTSSGEVPASTSTEDTRSDAPHEEPQS